MPTTDAWLSFTAAAARSDRNMRTALPQSPNARRPRARGAFTYAEMMVVVLVLAILAAVAAPRYVDATASFRVQAAAQRIAADLRAARRHAKVGGTSQAVQFSVTNNNYTLPGINDLDHRGQAYQVDLADTEYPVTLTTANFGGSETVTFDMYGRPDNGGAVTVTSGTHSRTVNVDADTGQPEIL